MTIILLYSLVIKVRGIYYGVACKKKIAPPPYTSQTPTLAGLGLGPLPTSMGRMGHSGHHMGSGVGF